MLIGKTIDEIELNIGELWFEFVDHSQLRWLGPEKELCTWLLLQFLIAYGILLLKKPKTTLEVYR